MHIPAGGLKCRGGQFDLPASADGIESPCDHQEATAIGSQDRGRFGTGMSWWRWSGHRSSLHWLWKKPRQPKPYLTTKPRRMPKPATPLDRGDVLMYTLSVTSRLSSGRDHIPETSLAGL
jgi:hypothetical protein